MNYDLLEEAHMAGSMVSRENREHSIRVLVRFSRGVVSLLTLNPAKRTANEGKHVTMMKIIDRGSGEGESGIIIK